MAMPCSSNFAQSQRMREAWTLGRLILASVLVMSEMDPAAAQEGHANAGELPSLMLRATEELSFFVPSGGPWLAIGTDLTSGQAIPAPIVGRADNSQEIVSQGEKAESSQMGAPSLPAEAMSMEGSLSLRYLLDKVSQTHPSVQALRLDIRASAEDRRAQERQRWPALSALVENRSTNAVVGATRVLRVEQTLWDAGRLSARINEAGTAVTINETRMAITAQQLSLQLIAAWQNLKSAEGRMAVAQQALAQLASYRAQMERRVQAEASPPIDLELMLSRIFQTEVEFNQARSTRAQALSRIEQLAGLTGLQQLAWRPPVLPAFALTQAHIDRLIEIDWDDVVRRHPSVEKTRQESAVARQRLEGKRAELYPQIYMRVDRPIGTINNDVAGFVGFRYTPGAGLSTAVEVQALSERVASSEQATEVVMREVGEALTTDREDLATSRSRMVALEKAVAGARAVLESFGRQFIAGRKSWLDLLNAVRELSQNQYALADAQAAMLAALYRLQLRMGEPVQPVS